MFGTKPASDGTAGGQSVSDDHFGVDDSQPLGPWRVHNDNGDGQFRRSRRGDWYGSVKEGASLIFGDGAVGLRTATLIDMKVLPSGPDTITANYLEMECRPRVRVRRRRPSPLGHDPRGTRRKNRGVPGDPVERISIDTEVTVAR